MPKSRKRKIKRKPTPAATPMLSRERAILLEQARRFREKFGRDPGPFDPVFFDPSKDEPTPFSTDYAESQTLEAMR